MERCWFRSVIFVCSKHGLLSGSEPYSLTCAIRIALCMVRWSDRKPPNWEDARRHVLEYTKKQIALGLAPEGILRTLEPGPWDNDPGFWRDVGDSDETMDYELDEDDLTGLFGPFKGVNGGVTLTWK